MRKIFLSHGHDDCTGGLPDVLKLKGEAGVHAQIGLNLTPCPNNCSYCKRDGTLLQWCNAAGYYTGFGFGTLLDDQRVSAGFLGGHCSVGICKGIIVALKGEKRNERKKKIRRARRRNCFTRLMGESQRLVKMSM